jgi:hypothetical protein
VSERPVFPFFVGSGRSGTTLLRVIFDSHSELAIPDESNFVLEFARRRAAFEGQGGFVRDRFVTQVFEQRSVRRWGIDADDVREMFEQDPPRDLADGVRAVFAAYARRCGKPRAGDKTPRYVLDLPLLAGLFPEGRFVDVVRDGRDVALSFLDVDFGPRSIGEAALAWRERVEAGRRAGSALGPDRYRAVRYEDLLEDVEGVVRSLCGWLELDFEPQMLRYHERADLVSFGEMWKYRNVVRPPTAGMRDWRTQMAPRDVGLFEALAGPALEAAGYERVAGPPPASTRVRAVLVRLRAGARARLRSWRRSLRRSPATDGGPASHPIGESGLTRSDVLSRLVARAADEDPEVQAYRSEVLGGALLPLERVPEWIGERVDPATEPDGAIEYVGPAGSARREIAAVGDLGRLMALGQEVAARSGWSAGQATTFVLTGVAPRIEPIRTQVTGGHPVGSSTRIVLEVDPAVEPREVLRRYRRLRRRVVSVRPRGPDRRELALAAFWVEHPGEVLEELFETWNRSHPTMAYDDRDRFERELVLARRRLLDPPW